VDPQSHEGAAAEGRTVFVSSHLMSEMENTADHLLVIAGARSSPTARSPSSSRNSQQTSGSVPPSQTADQADRPRRGHSREDGDGSM